MNEPGAPVPSGQGRAMRESAQKHLDPTDMRTIAAIADLYSTLDPVPDGLVDRLKFGLALDEMMAEVAELTRNPEDAMAVRGEAAATRTETITFSADQLTAMVTVRRTGNGRVRLDGWIAPEGKVKVRLKLDDSGETFQTSSDATGRFVFDDMPEGVARLTFTSGVGGAGAIVVTPLFEL